MPRAIQKCFHSQGRRSPRVGMRTARQMSMARMAYSVRCAPLRATNTTLWTVWSLTFGNSQRRMGSTIREERGNDWVSLEPTKISDIQSTKTSQYLRKMPSFCTGEWKQDLAMRGNDFNWPDAGPAGSQRVFQFASRACFWHITRMMRCLPKWL